MPQKFPLFLSMYVNSNHIVRFTFFVNLLLLSIFQYHIEGNNAVFFVEEAGAAESLSSLNKQITLHDGFQVFIINLFFSLSRNCFI